MGAERYTKYLPPLVAQLKEFQKLGHVESAILQEMEQAKHDVEIDQWIQTATKKGLLRRMHMMGLRPRQEQDTEALRTEVLAKWHTHKPYTWWILCQWLDAYCGVGKYEITLDYAKYTLKIVLALSQKHKQKDILLFWRDLLPANILFLVDLRRNTHADVAVMTHQGLKDGKWSYGEIPFVDFSAI